MATISPGCIFYNTYTAEKGTALDQQSVQQIVIGKTTRADILKSFGPPHSIFQGQGELLVAEHVGWYRYAETRQLTSFDEQHYALLYRFGVSSARSVLVFVVGQSDASIKAEELLIFINKKSHIVSDVAYRNETARR
jgi:hypothetical protein